MPFVIAMPEMVTAAATDLAGIGSTLGAAAAPTTGGCDAIGAPLRSLS